MVFDDNFSTVPYLCSGTVPDNWKQLVDNSRERNVEGFYDITKTWFEGEADVTADAPTFPIMRSSDSQPVATREEDAVVATPIENAATPSFAADEIVAAVNPIDDVASLLPAVPPTENIASKYSTSSPTEAVVEMNSDMPPMVDLATAGLRCLP